MTLPCGSRLGPYEISTPLGEGGMGAVYRARDTRLARDVAIKILSPQAKPDQATRSRFQREARAVASLNHPNICAIHDVGTENGVDYLVLELIDGESLAARLQRGALPLQEALMIGIDVARAVGHAHRAGIVHRDLKPANIMLTRDGVKVLDFGLARLIDGNQSLADQRTRTGIDGTAPGIVMGTLPYMSPEQVEGRSVDARSDVFSFGATMFETLAGKRAFDAPSGPSLVASILRDDPPSLMSINPDVPRSVDRVIRTCLAKQADDRLSDMNDVRVALDWARSDTADGSASPTPSSSTLSRRAMLAAGVAVVASGAGYLVGSRRRSPAAVETSVFDLPLPTGFRPGPGVALSPDGRRLAASFNPNQSLFLYDRSVGAWRRPANVATNALYPCWSPDGTEVAYFSGDVTAVESKLWRCVMPDGIPVLICDFNEAGGKYGAWLADDTIVIAAGRTALLKVAAKGGEPREFIPLAAGDLSLRFPTAAGNFVLYLAQREGKPSELRQARLDGSQTRVVPAPITQSAAFDRGRLYFARDGVAMSQPYELSTATLSGVPQRVPHDFVASALNIGHLQVAAGGGHVAILNTHRGSNQLVWRDRSGARSGTLGGVAESQSSPDISPDGRSVVVCRGAADRPGLQLWLVDIETGAERRLHTSEYSDTLPIWGADSQQIAFRSLRGWAGNGNIYSLKIGNSRSVAAIDEGPFSMYPVGWLPDGSFVWTTDAASRSGDEGVWLVANGARRQIIRDIVKNARLSPDHTRIAYESRISGRAEIYVDSFPELGTAPMRVSRAGGQDPRWGSDGGELLFLEGASLLGARVMRTPRFSLAPAEPLFVLDSDPLSGPPSYAVHPDGRRVLVLEDRSATTYSVRLTMNWDATSLSTGRLPD